MRVEDIEVLVGDLDRPYSIIGPIEARVTSGAGWNKARTVEDVNSKLREVALKKGASAESCVSAGPLTPVPLPRGRTRLLVRGSRSLAMAVLSNAEILGGSTRSRPEPVQGSCKIGLRVSS